MYVSRVNRIFRCFFFFFFPFFRIGHALSINAITNETVRARIALRTIIVSLTEKINVYSS